MSRHTLKKTNRRSRRPNNYLLRKALGQYFSQVNLKGLDLSSVRVIKPFSIRGTWRIYRPHKS